MSASSSEFVGDLSALTSREVDARAPAAAVTRLSPSSSSNLESVGANLIRRLRSRKGDNQSSSSSYVHHQRQHQNTQRQQQQQQLKGTEIVLGGEIEFLSSLGGNGDDSSREFPRGRILGGLIEIGTEKNQYIVSNVTSNGHLEFSSVFVVLIERMNPTDAPSTVPSST